MTIGAVCVLAALSLLTYNRIIDCKAGDFSNKLMNEIKAYIENSDNYDDSDNTDTDDINYDDKYGVESDDIPSVGFQGSSFMGYLSIPNLQLNLPVMSNWDYEKLNISPCRYSGSVLTDDLVIAAHNYDSHFGRISSLTTGDEVFFMDVIGKEYKYEVKLLDTLNPVDVDRMTSGEYDLSLFTCDFSGAARITVRCTRLE